jgi:hypothetical protein
MKSNAFKTSFAGLLGLFMSLYATTVYSVDNSCLGTMKAGKYQGQCMDTSLKRAVHVEAVAPATLTIANFRKAGVFYKASIPLDQIESLSYVVVDLNTRPVNFLSLFNISHTQLRFKLKPGAFARLTSEQSGEVQNENDFLVSFNFMAPKGVPYNPLKGFNGSLYGSVIQIFATQDEVKNRFVNSKINMYEMKLNVTTEQAGKILTKAMELSDRYQYEIPYDTWSSNCTTYLFDILDQALGYQGKPYRFKPWTAADAGLIPALKALAQRNLMADTEKVQLVNAEFGFSHYGSWSNGYFGFWTGKTWAQIQENLNPLPRTVGH